MIYDFLHFWEGLNFSPITFATTRVGFTGTLSLDIFATNSEEKICKTAQYPAAGISDHDIIGLEVSASCTHSDAAILVWFLEFRLCAHVKLLRRP